MDFFYMQSSTPPNKSKTNTPPSKETPPDQVSKRVNKLFFEPQTNPKSRYEKIFQIFGLMLITMVFTVFVKMEYISISNDIPLLAIIYFGIFLIQIQIIKIRKSEVIPFVLMNVLFFMLKSSIDMVYLRYGIIQTESIYFTNLEYTLLTFITGYIFIIIVRFRFKPKFRYAIVLYHILFVFTFDLYLNHYFVNPNTQYLLILFYWMVIEGIYYLLLYHMLVYRPNKK